MRTPLAMLMKICMEAVRLCDRNGLHTVSTVDGNVDEIADPEFY